MKQPDPFTTTTTPVDRRLLTPGLTVTVADLVAVFIDHRPGDLPTCGACQHRYTTAARLCPSRTFAEQLLKRRQHEDPKAVAAIAKELNHHRDTRVLPPPRPTPTPGEGEGEGEGEGLFAVEPGWCKPKTTGRRPRPT